MTKDDLLKLLEPYGPGEQIVFVTYDAGIVVHEEAEVAKDHSTKRTARDGSVSMPIAIYLVDDGKRGKGGVLGVDDVREVLPQEWPKLLDPRSLHSAARALLDARDAEMLTEEEWDGLARALDPAPPRNGVQQRFLYDEMRGLVRVLEADGREVLRQSAIPDALAAVADFAESREGSFFIEGARRAEAFRFAREDVEAACEFLVHLGLLGRHSDGSYRALGGDLAARAVKAMNALPTR